MRDEVKALCQQQGADVGRGPSVRPGKGGPFWGGASEPGESTHPNPSLSQGFAQVGVTRAAGGRILDWCGRSGVKSQLFHPQ